MNIERLKKGKRRSRRAASEIMGAILMVGVTLSVGFAAWAWVSGAARVAEANLNNSATENFQVISANFSATNSKLVTLMIYNSEPGSSYLTNITVGWASSYASYSSSCTFKNACTLQWTNGTRASTSSGSNCRTCELLKGQTITLINLNLVSNFTLTTSYTYTFKVIGQYGTVAQYIQVG